MRLIKAIEILNKVLMKHGDIRIHVEIGSDVPCDKCGDTKYRCKTGMCSSIDSINVNGEMCAFIVADED